MPGTQSADAMPQVNAIRATRALHGAMMRRERYCVTLRWSRLCTINRDATEHSPNHLGFFQLLG
jgi:hypothetical protein